MRTQLLASSLKFSKSAMIEFVLAYMRTKAVRLYNITSIKCLNGYRNNMQSVLHQACQLGSTFPRSLRPSKKTALLILVVASTTLLISTIISMLLTRIGNLDIPSLGNLKTQDVEAYWDADLTNKIDEHDIIDWGTLWLGASSNVTIYLLSISNIETALNLMKTSLTFYDTKEVAIQPPTNISDHMNLTWDYNGSMLRPGDDIQVTLTLSADYSHDFIDYLIKYDVRIFRFDILIRATEYSS